jgi:hypothetical protein
MHKIYFEGSLADDAEKKKSRRDESMVVGIYGQVRSAS